MCRNRGEQLGKEFAYALPFTMNNGSFSFSSLTHSTTKHDTTIASKAETFFLILTLVDYLLLFGLSTFWRSYSHG